MTSVKRIVLPDVARRAWSQARVNLSANWRRDADGIRKTALKAEKRAAIALSHGWGRLKPKVVHVEHKMHDGLLGALRRLRRASS